MAYDKEYRKTLSVTADGIGIVWAYMPPKDVAGNLKVIKGAYAELKKSYKASLKIKQNSVTLTVDFKKPANEDQVLALESIGCGLLPATKWGGP